MTNLYLQLGDKIKIEDAAGTRIVEIDYVTGSIAGTKPKGGQALRFHRAYYDRRVRLYGFSSFNTTYTLL